jgi:hypothetical protein
MLVAVNDERPLKKFLKHDWTSLLRMKDPAMEPLCLCGVNRKGTAEIQWQLGVLTT